MPYLIALSILMFSAIAGAQGVPSNLQAAIFYKVLAYDYNIQSKSGSDITIVVVTDNKSAGQKGPISAGFQKISGQKLGSKTIKIVVLSISGAGELESKISSTGADIVYVADGSSDVVVSQMIKRKMGLDELSRIGKRALKRTRDESGENLDVLNKIREVQDIEPRDPSELDKDELYHTISEKVEVDKEIASRLDSVVMKEVESISKSDTKKMEQDQAVSTIEWVLYGNPIRRTPVGPNADFTPGRLIVDT